MSTAISPQAYGQIVADIGGKRCFKGYSTGLSVSGNGLKFEGEMVGSTGIEPATPTVSRPALPNKFPFSFSLVKNQNTILPQFYRSLLTPPRCL